jgi:hypothetical protein
MLQRAMVACVMAVLALLVVGALIALFDYAFYGDDYRFGTEVAGFTYRSAYHFVGSAVAQSVLGVGAIALLVPLMRRKIAISTRDVITALLVLGTLGVAFAL